MICERKISSFRSASAMVAGGGGAAIADSNIIRLKPLTEIADDICQWGLAAVINDDRFELRRR
jgi:hypothetical protein